MAINTGLDYEEIDDYPLHEESQDEAPCKYKERNAIELKNFLEKLLRQKSAEDVPSEFTYFDDNRGPVKPYKAAFFQPREHSGNATILLCAYPNRAYALVTEENIGFMHPDGSQDDLFLAILEELEKFYEI